MDSLSIQPLGPIFQLSFVALMFDPPHYIQNCIFGFPPSSQFMRFVLALVREHSILAKFNKKEVSVKYGPVFFTSAFVRWNFERFMILEISDSGKLWR